LKFLFYFLSLVLFLTQAVNAQSFILKGKILSTNNIGIPFASVFIAHSTYGTSANHEGDYSIDIYKNKTTLICRAIGYKTKIINLDSLQSNYLDISLETESFLLNPVSVVANYNYNGQQIIQKGIDNRVKNNEIYKRYSVDVYVKSMQKLVNAPKKFLGINVKKELNLDSNGKGILYLAESQSQLNFEAPSSIKEIMISSQTTGKEGGFPISKASDLTVSFYQNLVNWPKLSVQSFVSPIADNALQFYNYKLLGINTINGNDIYKIAVLPKHTYDPVFAGFIYIIKNSYKIYGVNLKLSSKANINFVDSLVVQQQYINDDNNNWLPSTVNFKFFGKILGFSFEGYLSGINNNYNANPNFKPDFFNNEILRIDSNANNRDSAYLANHRPEPLSKDEELKIRSHYKTLIIAHSKAYLDSVEKASNKFKIIPFALRGFKLKNYNDRVQWDFDALAPAFFYNTVEGFGINYGVSYRKDFGIRSFSIKPIVRYTTKEREFNGDLTLNFLYNPIKRASFKLNFGSAYRDLNPNGSLNSLNNSLNTILFAQNFMKLFKKEYVSISGGRDLYNGLYFSSGLELARRYSLINIDTFTFRDIKRKNFTSNNPLDPTNNTKLFPDNTALNFSASLVYSINQKYSTKEGAKYYELPKWPRLILNYRKGVSGIFKSTADYDFLELEVQQEKINTGLMGYSSFSISAGKFINQRELYFPDYKHFAGNLTLVFNPGLKNFHFLDYYAYSTDNHFFEGHYEHNFTGFFVRKIPLLRKLKLEEILGISHLSQPIKGSYTEFYIGLQRWFFKVDYAFAFNNQGYVQQGFRIFYGL